MGQINCVSKQPKLTDTDQKALEKVYDTDGNQIDELLPGLDDILNKINVDQYEHIGRTFKITEVKLRPPKQREGQPPVDPDRPEVLVIITKANGQIGNNNHHNRLQSAST